MILAASMLIAATSGDIAFPAVLGMLGLLGLQRRFTWVLRPERRVISSLLMLLLAVIFALHYSYFGLSAGASYGPAGAPAWQTISRYFLASMILVLFLGSPDRLPATLGLFYLAITISAGQVLLLDDRYVLYRVFEIFAVILVVLYVTGGREPVGVPHNNPARRKSQHLLVAGILLLAANVGWIAGSVLYRHVEILNYLPVWFWRTETALGYGDSGIAHLGFSTSGRLSSILTIQQDQDMAPVLSVISEKNPGYLRARAFDIFRQSEWHDLSNKEAMFPLEGRTFGMYIAGRNRTFQIDAPEPADAPSMTIKHEAAAMDAIFAPLGAYSIEAPMGLLLRDDDNIVYAQSVPAGTSYRIDYSRAPNRRPPYPFQRRRMLNIPRDLPRTVDQLAADVFRGAATTARKIDAVVEHFRTNYTYSLNPGIPPGRDKLTYFLLNGASGYCEYFASGSAILLRLAGVPTRYVTGFLVTERSTEDDLWIVRNLNAHAWVEAWDDQRNQWIIVEATVQDALPNANEDDDLAATGAGGLFFRRFLQYVYEYGLLGAVAWLLQSYGLTAGLALFVIFAGTALLISLHRRQARSRPAGPDARLPLPPAQIAMQNLLAAMDEKLRRAGRNRRPNETLHAFSRRLRAADAESDLWSRVAAWYARYANLRYRRTIPAEQLTEIRRQARTLRQYL